MSERIGGFFFSLPRGDRFNFPDVRSFFRDTFLCKDDGGGGGADGAGAVTANGYCSQLYTPRELALKYLPILVLFVFFWPVVLTLIVTVISASSWVLWLFTSLCVGVVQMLYVTYQFLMIFLDLLMISALKTFATLRSQVRYYTIKSGLSKKRRGRSRRGRRREWKNKLDNACTYKDYNEIEIDEVESNEGKEVGGDGKNRHRPPMKRGAWSVSLRGIHRNAESGNGGGGKDNGSARPPLGPRVNNKVPPARSRMRKSQSCVDMESVEGNGENGSSFINRVKSTENFARSHSSPEGASEHGGGGGSPRSVENELKMAGGMLITTTARLREARSQAASPKPPRSPSSSPRRKKGFDDARGGVFRHNDDEEEGAEESSVDDDDVASSLKYLLTGVVKRNHLSVDDMLIEDAQSVAECGRHRFSLQAREVITGYNEELERCLDFIAESPVVRLGDGGGGAPPSSPKLTTVNGEWTGTVALEAAATSDDQSTVMHRQGAELSDRIVLLRKLKQNMGRTALMLSGGGAQAMYHLGTVRALVESGLYKDIKVISGTSGGSITAAMCALKTPEELFEHVCVRTVSTDYMLDGTMKRENIRWFPKLVDMIPYWLKHKLLVDSAEFKRCCDFYWGDVTFEEAYQRTKKHVCITVSASRAGAGGKAQRLLLNHISTPHVTLASAVACSCALPGVMAPAKLVTKNSRGGQEAFEVDGVEWIDGSVQADLPFKRISTLFNVSNFIVCQTNFHVVPLLRKAHHPGEHSLYWRAFQACEWDIRGRVLTLSRLGLFPKVFGHDISKVFKQKYHGNITLVPRFTTMQLFGLKALVNPTVEDMEVYLKNGQIAAWPYLCVIKEMLRVECKIDKCIARLEQRLDDLVPDNNGAGDALHAPDDDDVESISSYSVVSNRLRFLSSHREAELLRQKVQALERENARLRGQVGQLQRAMGIVSSPSAQTQQLTQTAQVRAADDGIEATPSLSFNLSEDDEQQQGQDGGDNGNVVGPKNATT